MSSDSSDRGRTVLVMPTAPFQADPHLAEFLIDMRDQGQSPATLQLRRQVLTMLVKQTRTPLLQQTPESLHLWFRSYSDHAPATRHAYAASLRSFWRWAIRRRLTETDPTAALPVPTVRPGKPRPISVEDARTALSEADERMRLWLLLGLTGGLRAAEVARARREELADDSPLLEVLGKGAKHRDVLLPERVAADLRGWRRRGRFWPVTAHTVTVQVSRFFDELGMPWRFHSCRHAHATWLYATSGGDLLLTAKQLGHSDTRTTASYAQTSTPKLVTSVNDVDTLLRGEEAA